MRLLWLKKQPKLGKLMVLGLTMVFLLATVLLFSACREKSDPARENLMGNDTLTIATSFYPIYIATMNITKDVPGVKVVNMAPQVTGCLHDYQLNPDDIKKLNEAQIFVVNGAGMEAFMDKVVGQLPDLRIVDASQGVSLLISTAEEEGNPHLWVSISNAIQQVENIGEQLAALDPEHAVLYDANSAAYINQLTMLRSEMHLVLDGIAQRDIIVFHEAFPYFAQEFNLNIVAVIEREPGTEPGAAELTETIDTVNRLGIKVLFAEPQYARGTADIIARETGARVFILDPVVTGPMEPDAYLKIMEANLRTLTEALR